MARKLIIECSVYTGDYAEFEFAEDHIWVTTGRKEGGETRTDVKFSRAEAVVLRNALDDFIGNYKNDEPRVRWVEE